MSALSPNINLIGLEANRSHIYWKDLGKLFACFYNKTDEGTCMKNTHSKFCDGKVLGESTQNESKVIPDLV